MYKEKLSQSHSRNYFISGFKNVKNANISFKPTRGGFQI